MKKSLVLGTAALAALVSIPLADAAEITWGGYYRFQAIHNETTNNQDDDNEWYLHRINFELDMRTSPKTHAHMRWRPVDDATVDGVNNPANNNAHDDVERLWLETEAWGVTVKAGKMPLSLNDDLLLNSANKSGTAATGAVVLAKSFGDTTVVGAHVKVQEAIGGAACAGKTLDNWDGAGGVYSPAGTACDNDDIDIWAASVLGKMDSVNYQLTSAYQDGGSEGGGANVKWGDNWWLALTLNGQYSGVDLTGTVIYEAGNDEATNGTYVEESGFMVGLRAKGKASFGDWNAYGFYGDEDYTAPFHNQGAGTTTPLGQWSYAYANDGMFDMVGDTLGRNTTGRSVAANNYNRPSQHEAGENAWGLGAGLKMKAGGWTINPMIDYITLEDDSRVTGNTNDEDVWGGSLVLSTMVDEGAQLSLYGGLYDPDEKDSNHHLMAEMKVSF